MIVRDALSRLAQMTEGEARALVEVVSCHLGFGHASQLAQPVGDEVEIQRYDAGRHVLYVAINGIAVLYADHLAALAVARKRWDAQLAAAQEQVKIEKDKPAKNLPRLVVCALIIRDGKVLLEKRAPAGVKGLDNKWDLPGGKVEPREQPEEAIIREIAEELSVGVRPIRLIPYLLTSTWTYGDGQTRHWVLAAYICEIISGEPKTSSTLQWFDVNNLKNVDILEADLRLVQAAIWPTPTEKLSVAHDQVKQLCNENSCHYFAEHGLPINDEYGCQWHLRGGNPVLCEAYAASGPHKLKEQVRRLTEALEGVMGLIDSGTLQRDISGDGEPGWAIKMMPPFVQTLAAARAVLPKENPDMGARG